VGGAHPTCFSVIGGRGVGCGEVRARWWALPTLLAFVALLCKEDLLSINAM